MKRFWLLRISAIKRHILIKHLRNGIFVKSNTKHFTAFSSCNLSGKSVWLALLFFSDVEEHELTFPLTVPNHTWQKMCENFSPKSPEFYSCMQFEIRKRLTCWFCYAVKPPCLLRSNKPLIIWLLKTTVLSLEYLINATLVVPLGDVYVI